MSLAARPSDPKNSNMSKAEFLAKVDRVRLSRLGDPVLLIADFKPGRYLL